MAVVQSSCTVQMPVSDAERRWNEFVSSQQQGGATAQAPAGGNGQDPGNVYFNQVDDNTTEVTIQLNPEGIATGDEQTLNQRVDGYLQRFKSFVEGR